MYYKNNRSRRSNGNSRYGSRGNGAGRRGNFRRGNFRVRTFDPSQVINNANMLDAKCEECEIKHAFGDFAIDERLKMNIARNGFTTPTPIQDQAIEPILKNCDVVGIANTGTGKTAAFLIPLINKVMLDRRQKVLIIAPTRELAIQIENDLYKLTNNLEISSVVCIGGVSINKQIHKLRARPQFVIGTPGRLLDLNKQRKLNFNQFASVVLDEVDRMLDMGFIRDVRKIISQLPRERQSLFFSATVGDKVMSVMKQFTKNPLRISVKAQDAAVNVNQEVVKVNGKGKLQMLREMLDQREFEKVLVFARTKRGVDKLTRDLTKIGFLVSAIHGNKSQSQRQRSLEMFRKGKVSVLIATDVVARGIDVNNITHVVNYELPETYEHYLHRIGRTGRAGKKGKAVTFVN